MANGPFHPFAGTRIAVVGLGRAGLPAARRLREWGAAVNAWDDGIAAREQAAAEGFSIVNPGISPWAWDALLLSPGIPHRLPEPHPAAAAARQAGVPILSDIEFLHAAVRATGSRARFAGITGTNGKSTTTALLGHLLRSAGISTEVGGNLGPPALGMALLGDEGVYVLEMSSYSLERIAQVRFNVAAMLNLSPDHLDRHGDMPGYRAAKARIFARQEAGDVAVLGQDDEWTASLAPELAARIVPISGSAPQPGGVWAEGGWLMDAEGGIANLSLCPALPGTHNAQNAAAACAMALALGAPRSGLEAGLRSYPGLPHRQEVVAEIAGVAFVNDSKATNADSAARALASYARVVWLAGGMGKAGGIGDLAPLFPRVAEAVLFGQDGAAFAATLAAHGVPHRVVRTLEEAVPLAAEAAFGGAAPVVLLSPAAASFDQFSGFDARGDRFRQLVLELTKAPA
jgi:UDP-N-acetylmuramoylalanine--D-glutamate ligase